MSQLAVVMKMLGVDPAEMQRAVDAIASAGALLKALDQRQDALVSLLSSMNARLELIEAQGALITRAVTMTPALTNGKAGDHGTRHGEPDPDGAPTERG